MSLIDTFMSFLETLKTGSGFWNPLVWGVAIVLVLLIAYIIRGFGKKDFKKGKKQTKVSLSGDEEYKKVEKDIKASNIYWGFLHSLKWFYNAFDKMHTGNVSDYILWFVVVMGILFIIIGVI